MPLFNFSWRTPHSYGGHGSWPVYAPFRFGVFAEGVRSREALLDTARRAEDGGFATFLMRDHFIAEPFGHQLAPF